MNDVTFEFLQACFRGDLDKLTNLLRRKEEIDVKQLDECPLLVGTAVRKGQLEIVRLLISVGVNVNPTNPIGGGRPLHFACKVGNLPIAELLLENGADIDAIVESLNWKWTPLHIAVWIENTSITKLLLKNGCKINVRNHEGLTALEFALKKRYLDGVKQLALHDE